MTLKMSASGQFWLGTITSRKPPIVVSSSLPPNNGLEISQASETTSIKLPNRNSLPVTRREVVGLGLGSLLLSLPEKFNVASAADSPCEFTSTQSGLSYCDKVLGTGSKPSKGQLIKAHYVGKLENGKVFDSSYNRGKTLTFRVGVGEVIKGWDQGILGGDGVPLMLAGGKRTLKIPPELGYGVRGAGCKGGNCIIPPDSVLLFDVEYIGKV